MTADEFFDWLDEEGARASIYRSRHVMSQPYTVYIASFSIGVNDLPIRYGEGKGSTAIKAMTRAKKDYERS